MPTTTTIIQRGSTRRILNIDAVVGLLREMNFPNIQVVDMSANTTKEQMQIVRCSGLLIGECAEHGEMRECECECEECDAEYWVWPWRHQCSSRLGGATAAAPLARCPTAGGRAGGCR